MGIPHEIIFQDADFPHRFAWCRSKLEGPSLRWIPYGMPRLNPFFDRSVFFLYAMGEGGKLLGPGGSGVIVGYRDPVAPGVQHFYAVTAAHVAYTGTSVIVLNTDDGKTRPIELDPSEWVANLDREDIAMVDITDRLTHNDLFSHIPIVDMIADKHFLTDVAFGIGEDGFMLGLFSEHSGREQHMIAARFGNVSLLARESEPISRFEPSLRRNWNTPCHVFDMHSRPGFSGSPVFVYRTPDGDLRDAEMRGTRRSMLVPTPRQDDRHELLPERIRGSERVEMVELDPHNNKFLKLFGIHVGQFHDAVKITKVTKESEKSQELHDGDTIRFPGSMTIVVPAWEITELMNNSRTLNDMRVARRRAAQNADKRNQKRGAVILEDAPLGSGGEAVQAIDNPFHKEDFRRLLGAAAPPRKPASET